LGKAASPAGISWRRYGSRKERTPPFEGRGSSEKSQLSDCYFAGVDEDDAGALEVLLLLLLLEDELFFCFFF